MTQSQVQQIPFTIPPIERLPIERINPAPYNPRKDLHPGDPEYEKLKRSLEEFGCVERPVWNRQTGNLIGGHQRLKILIAQGQTEVDVNVVDLDPDQEKVLNLALNKIAGNWDNSKLAELLDELTNLPEFDVEVTGFDQTEIEDLLSEHLDLTTPGEESFDVEAELNANRPIVSERGELIELGRQRLLVGDCTEPEDVTRLMGNERAILFATDPPYLVNYDGTNHPASRQKRRPTADKNKDWSDTYAITWDDADANSDLYEKFIRLAIECAISPKAAWYCWHASRRQIMVESTWNKFDAFVHQQLIWVKDRPILTRSWYLWQHEPCFYGWIRGQKPPRRARDYPSTIWAVPTVPVGQPTEHPTSKPLKLFEIPMLQHTVPSDAARSASSDLCYEPFAGSGSQLIAAERTGRRCYAIEISPRYCDVIVRRYIRFVGEQNIPQGLADRFRVDTPVSAQGGA